MIDPTASVQTPEGQILAFVRLRLRRTPTLRVLVAAGNRVEAQRMADTLAAACAELELEPMASVGRRWQNGWGGAVQVVEPLQALAGVAADLIVPTPDFARRLADGETLVRTWYTQSLRLRLRPGGDVIDLFT